VKEFRPGDKVVLPPYGVGVVAGIAQRSISGVSRAYYQVDFPGSRSKAYVPVEAPQSVGMRKALSPEEVPVILDLLKNGRMPLPKQWAARHRSGAAQCWASSCQGPSPSTWAFQASRKSRFKK
jgi:CarD family transcriptional regulator